MSEFTADVYQNEYLPSGGSEVSAIVTVTSRDGGEQVARPEVAEIAQPGIKVELAAEV